MPNGALRCSWWVDVASAGTASRQVTGTTDGSYTETVWSYSPRATE